MGNKCQFCRTFLGNVKRVAGVLQGNGCGCGRCSGQIESLEEATTIANFFKAQIELLEKQKDSLSELQQNYQNEIQKLREIKYIK